MPPDEITITGNFDGTGAYSTQTEEYTCDDDLNFTYIGLDGKSKQRVYIRFPLNSLVLNGKNVTQVKLKIYCSSGGTGHTLKVRGYNSNGQTDPSPDACASRYARCVSGNLYHTGTELRTTGQKEITLGGNACTDLQNAKSAVNRFSLGLHEDGDNDIYAGIVAIEHGTAAWRPQLVITYEEEAPPSGGILAQIM